MESQIIKKSPIKRDLDFDSIFEIDDSIRFVGVCTIYGKLLDAQYKNDVSPLLTDSSLQLSVMRTAIRSSTRIGDEGLMGKPVYSVTKYENVKRATIPLNNELLFLISFEKKTSESVLLPKVLEMLFEN